MLHGEWHRTESIGWLRAAVLGANDGLISTSSLVVGVAAANPSREPIVVAALAGLLAGALSMAAGEYVSVSSQQDTEHADLERERRELAEQPEFEHAELASIYVKRGLDPALADQVATQLMANDPLAQHARDELGITEISKARPLQAAIASAASFAIGAALPFVIVLFVSPNHIPITVTLASLVLLVALGAAAAKLGGSSIIKGAARVAFWGAMAMLCTYGVGKLFGTTVG